MSYSSNDISNTGGPGSAAEPSMEEILASIRRILKEDDGTGADAVGEEEDELLLDHGMMVKPADFGTATYLPEEPAAQVDYPEIPVETYADQAHFASEPAPVSTDFAPVEPAYEPEPVYEPESVPELAALATAQSYDTTPEPAPEALEPTPLETNMSDTNNTNETIEPPHGILSGATADAAASSIGALVRSISQEKSIAVSRNGITIEDIVREEIRPLLKSWLDTHLPSLVERVVRSEIERVIDRSAQ